MFKKNDPLIDAVKSVMVVSESDRVAETAVNEYFGVVSRKAIPHELQKNYDAHLEEAKKLVGEQLHGDQWKLDHNKNKKIEADDLHKVRKHGPVKKKSLEEGEAKQKWGDWKIPDHLKPPSKAEWEDSERKAGRDPDNPPPPPSKEEQKKIDDDWKKKMEAEAERLRNRTPEEKQAEVDDIIQDLDPNSERNKKKRVERGEPEEYDPKTSKGIERIEVPNRKGSSDKGKSSDEINDIIKGRLEEKLSKSMKAGDVISDFVHSKDPKFKGKSTKERQRMALGAYYGMHPEKSKKSKKEVVKEMTYKAIRKVNEQALWEEIRTNLEEQLVYAYDNLNEEDFASYIHSLSEEQLEILGLTEGKGKLLDLGKKILGLGGKGADDAAEAAGKAGKKADDAADAANKEKKILTPKTAAGAAAIGGIGGLVAGGLMAGQNKGGKGGGAPKSDKGDYPGGPKDSEKKWGFHDRNIQALKGTAPKKMTSGDLVNRSLGGVYEETKPQIKESFEQFLRNKFLKG